MYIIKIEHNGQGFISDQHAKLGIAGSVTRDRAEDIRACFNSAASCKLTFRREAFIRGRLALHQTDNFGLVGGSGDQANQCRQVRQQSRDRHP